MLTRKHFKEAAAILKDFESGMTELTHQNLVIAFSIMFKCENPRFDFDKFKTASTN